MDFDDDTKALLDKIHSTGYWRVVIRPTTFEPKRISLPECDSMLQDSVVRLRGWDYPHLKSERREPRSDYVQYTEDWSRYHELCRLYQSGQFVHHFSFREDYEGGFGGANRIPPEAPLLLSPVSTVYTFTEIFEFASRLASRGLLVPQAVVDVTLHGVRDRSLYDSGAHYSGKYVCKEEQLSVSDTFATDELLESSPKHARRFYVDVFHRFGWLKLGDDAYIQDQTKFLEKRLVY